MRKPLGKRGSARKSNDYYTGKSVGPVDGPDVNANPRTRKAPTMAVRWLFSCGYKTGTLRVARDGWMRGEVVDRKTGEARGTRWIRPRDVGGYEVRSVAP